MRGWEAGPFGVMVPAWALLPANSSGPGSDILFSDDGFHGTVGTTFLLKHFLPAQQTLGRCLLWGFKAIEKCSSGVGKGIMT